MTEEKEKSLPEDLDAWLKNILKKSESFQGTEAEKQANDEQLFLELFDGLVKLFRTNPDWGKDIQPTSSIVNQGILRGSLFIYTQVYYKIIEVVSCSEVAYADFLLNQYYLQVIKKIKYLLSLEEFKDFTGEFNPPEHILPSSGLGNIGWEDVVAPHVESFLASVQTFMNELDFHGNEPVEVTIVLKWLRKHVEPIIEKTEEYRITNKQHFNGLMKNLISERDEIIKAANHKEKKPQPNLASTNPAETKKKVERNTLMLKQSSSKENWEAIKKEYGISKKDFGKKINFVEDKFKRDVIFRDVEHAFVLVSQDFPKPAIILAGGVIEELLRLYLDHKNIKMTSDSFFDYIKACENNGLLKRGVLRLTDSVRDFRNLVHLAKETEKRHTISKATAKGAVSSIFTIVNDFQ